MTPTSRSRSSRSPSRINKKIGIVGDIAAGSAEMDDVAGLGADFAIGVDVGHDIVTQPAFVHFGAGEIDVVDMARAARRAVPGVMRGVRAVVGRADQVRVRLPPARPRAAARWKTFAAAPHSSAISGRRNGSPEDCRKTERNP